MEFRFAHNNLNVLDLHKSMAEPEGLTVRLFAGERAATPVAETFTSAPLTLISLPERTMSPPLKLSGFDDISEPDAKESTLLPSLSVSSRLGVLINE